MAISSGAQPVPKPFEPTMPSAHETQARYFGASAIGWSWYSRAPQLPQFVGSRQFA